jgi:hypothetical protein
MPGCRSGDPGRIWVARSAMPEDPQSGERDRGDKRPGPACHPGQRGQAQRHDGAALPSAGRWFCRMGKPEIAVARVARCLYELADLALGRDPMPAMRARDDLDDGFHPVRLWTQTTRSPRLNGVGAGRAAGVTVFGYSCDPRVLGF